MDTSNDNIRKLFDMLDNPSAYSEQEIRDIINSDEETRETYRLMVETKRSSRRKQFSQPADVDAAWQRFESLRAGEQVQGKGKNTSLFSGRYWMKHAASAIVILLISGIAFAAIHFVRTHSVEPQKAQTEDASNARQANSQFPSEVADPIHFDDVRLDSILTVVSAHYGKAVFFRNEEPRGMKLITTWNPADSLESFIDHLNVFDYVSLTLQNDTIFVESAKVEDGE